MLTSCLCTQEMLTSDVFEQWKERLKIRHGFLHRKAWDWCYICQALHERGCLQAGKYGLGFAVGNEPLSAMFCSMGAKILATDLELKDAEKAGWWKDTRQHADTLDALNAKGICDTEKFQRNCLFQYADMNDIKGSFHNFDFLWSSCALEHLGTLQAGIDFIINSLDCLKPGGVAVHTTEYNVSSNDKTVEKGGVVVYRRQDIEGLAARLRKAGHSIELDFTTGDMPADKHIDLPPYKQDVHLKLKLDEYVITTIGLVIQKNG